MNSQLYTLDPLFDFQAICDTDFGLYKLIKNEYYEKTIFDNYIFDSDDERFIKTILLSRQYFNPLTILCKKDALSMDDMDNLYKQFLDEEYDKILELSTPTAIMDIASISNDVNKIVNVNILCTDEREKEWVKKYNYKLKCIISEYNNFSLKKYDTIYLKDIYNLNLFEQKSISYKNIIIPRFIFNLEDTSNRVEMPIIEVAQKYYKTNKFMVTDPYKDILTPMSEMREDEKC